MARIIDKRPNGKNKSAVNRQRFMRRFKQQIQKSVRNAIAKRSIKEVDEKGEKIKISSKDTNEPSFKFGEGGIKNIILPGNREFIPGDKFQRPPQSSGSTGTQASNTGEGIDDFSFDVSRDEFLDLFFDDLALPNLIRTNISKIPSIKTVRAGYTQNGSPNNINIIRSMRGAISRRIALSGPYKAKIKELEIEIAELEKECDTFIKIQELKKEITRLQEKINSLPFIDPFDLRYNNKVKRQKPSSQAVMFCLMDVSGSMDEEKKDIAKRFFILLYLFLSRSYESVEVVFIRHHTSAKEVNEEEFFYSRETGGTVVSSALEMMKEVAIKRYPTQDWNIYAAQASDGDNWSNDSPRCKDLLISDILPLVQYFAYVEIMPRHHQGLWEAYSTIKDTFKQFAMQDIDSIKDIYPVFRELFKKQELTQN